VVEGASGAVDHISFREGVCEAALRVFAMLPAFISVEASGR